MDRCPWAVGEQYIRYHDEEWGVPCHGDSRLFEMLILEGAQAGLSWATILNRREGYRKAYHGFDIERVASYGERDVERLLAEPGIIRNRAKVHSSIANAKAALEAIAEFGSLNAFLWQFADAKQIQNRWGSLDEVPASTHQSEAMSKYLKHRGFGFVGPTICYAFMQAVGMVNDHLVSCPRWRELGGH